jgi:hypothetical protein
MSKHTLLVATELTTEDLLEIFVVLAEKLTHQRDADRKEAHDWKSTFEMYRGAWLREMGGTIIHKSHEIDGFVLRAQQIYKQAENWIAHSNGLLARDPFWMIPEPPAPTDATGETFRLCYVDDGFTAYFTTQELEKQWGDDWNDAPYEHNAGTPYTPHATDEKWEIKKVKFEGPFLLPCSNVANSGFSVEGINRGDIAWLRTESQGAGLMAGASIALFSTFVQQHGGKLYLEEKVQP